MESKNDDQALSYGSLLETSIVQYFGKNSLEHSIVLHQIGEVLIRKGAFNEASVKCKQALALGETLLAANNSYLKDILRCLANAAEQGKDAKAAAGWYERLLALAERTPDWPPQDIKDMTGRLSALYESQSMYEQSIRYRHRMIALLEQGPVADQRGYLDFEIVKLAEALKATGKHREAQQEFERALDAREQFEGKHSPSLVMILFGLGQVYIENKDLDRAVTVSQRAIDLVEREKVLGSENPILELPLTNLGISYLLQMQYDAAITAFERIVRINELSYGTNDARLVPSLQKLRMVYIQAERYIKVETTVRRMIALKKSLGAGDDDDLRSDTLLLAEVLMKLDRPGEAEPLLIDALARLEASRTAKSQDLLPLLDGLATVSIQQGRFSTAGRYLQRAIAIAQAEPTSDPKGMIYVLNTFGLLLLETERKDDARIMFERAYQLERKLAGSDDAVDLVTILNNRATVAANDADAIQLLEKTVRIIENNSGPASETLQGPLLNLAVRLNNMGEFDKAAQMLDRVIEIVTRVHRPDSPSLVRPLIDLSFSYVKKQDMGRSIELLERALAICEKSLPEYHPDKVAVLDALSVRMTHSQNYKAAVVHSRKAVDLVLAHSAKELSIDDNKSAKAAVDSRIGTFRNMAIALTLSGRTDQDAYVANGEELFEVAQWVNQSTASIAMRQMAVRLSVNNPGIAEIIRKRQNALAVQDKLRSRLSEIAANGRTEVAKVTQELRDNEAQLLALNETLKQKFPSYFEISGLKPTPAKEVQKQLKTGEALVSIWQIKDDIGLVFAVSSDEFAWDYIHVEKPDDRIKSFRSGLVETTGKPFDLQQSHELYKETLGKVEGVIRDKSNLLIAPSGVWAALPFHLLLTEAPGDPPKQDKSIYSNAPWLIKRQALSILPSVSSLQIFRNTQHRESASRPIVGFGNPRFGEPAPKSGARSSGKKVAAKLQTRSERASPTRSYGEFWKGAEIDRQKLSEALSPLPDTQEELTSVSQSLGGEANALYFGTSASESSVKNAKLSDFRIVYFATHGLVAGDVKGVGEPSLALTLPNVATELDDGLLTSSEISQLDLNADWVVLSACNTLAGNEPGGEALSGLARAFFYAGARSLLASHWAVESEAAVRLTTTTFKLLQQNPRMRRSDALRQAMLAVLNSDERSSAPSFWGAFSLIGE
ncbi:MAG TPA: CHAT domain-containing tetratricopeptide repeat protein [Pseudolabrys sp.]|nr:CHAT domain-containing tetratricopeptide repeat protein [Pseudolabrys sp.]